MNPLESWVKDAVAKGYSPDEIKDTLVKSGYSEEQALQAVKDYAGPMVPAPSTALEPPAYVAAQQAYALSVQASSTVQKPLPTWWSVLKGKTNFADFHDVPWGYKHAAKNIIFGNILLVLSSLAVGFGFTFITTLLGLGSAAGFIAPYAVFIPVALVAWLVVSFFLGLMIPFALARLFGGKGSFRKFAVSQSYITAPVSLLMIVPVVNVLVLIWSVYLSFKELKEYFNLNALKALAVLLLPSLVIAGLLFTVIDPSLDSIMASLPAFFLETLVKTVVGRAGFEPAASAV